MRVSVGKLTRGEVIFFHMMQPLLSADVWCPAESLTSELNISSNRRGTQGALERWENLLAKDVG